MAYTAEKLAAIFGGTVSDLMAINSEILIEQNQLMSTHQARSAQHRQVI
jgi:hypothetical protein